MKQKIKKTLLAGAIIIMTLSIFAFVGCGGAERHPNSDPNISTELEIQLRQHIVNNSSRLRMKNVWVAVYYGTFEGSTVVLMRTTDILSPAMIYEEVNSFEFWTNTGENISVWSDRKFYSLTHAFDNNLLSACDIIEIHYKHSS